MSPSRPLHASTLVLLGMPAWLAGGLQRAVSDVLGWDGGVLELGYNTLMHSAHAGYYVCMHSIVHVGPKRPLPLFPDQLSIFARSALNMAIYLRAISRLAIERP